MPTDLLPASQAVAVEVLVRGPRSRAQLARTMGLSPATLTRVVKPLLKAGVLVESGAVRTPGRGRSSVPLDVAADGYRFVGVALTPEWIRAVVTDLRAEVLDVETAAPPSLAVPDVVSAVADLVARLRSRAERPIDALGVTVGGRVEAGEQVVESSALGWSEVPLRGLLAERVDLPLFLANEVVGLTRAQQWFGAGRTCSAFALVSVGADPGYGLVIDDELVPTLVGCIRHLPVDPSGPLCAAGHRGCLSAYVGPASITAAVGQALGRTVTFDEVLALAEAGDPPAVRVVDEAARALGRATAAVTSLTAVERIVVSGDCMRLAEIGHEALLAGHREYADPRNADPHNAGPEPVVAPMNALGWARGAAVVAIRQVFPNGYRTSP